MKHLKTLDKILVIVAVFVFLFIVTMCVFFCIFQQIPDTLVTCVLGSSSVELILTAVIEIYKKKTEKKDEFNTHD